MGALKGTKGLLHLTVVAATRGRSYRIAERCQQKIPLPRAIFICVYLGNHPHPQPLVRLLLSLP